MYIVPIAYHKLKSSANLEPYKEEILSEGMYALCVASHYCDCTKKDNPFSYLFSAVIAQMYKFINEFIYNQSAIMSLEENSSSEDLDLIDLITSTPPEFCENYIEDILCEYTNQVMLDPKLSQSSKLRRTSPKLLTRLHDILVLNNAGYDGNEIGTALGISRQAVHNNMQYLREHLKNSCYRLVD